MVMGVNINSYYREKKEIEAYISTFSYIMKLLDISDQFEHVDIPEVEQYVQEIIRAKKQFGKFKRVPLWWCPDGIWEHLLQNPSWIISVCCFMWI